MRICATADLHGNLPEIPQCELLLLGGDLCPTRNHDVDYQAHWIEADFSRWLRKVKKEVGCEIVGISGNHDFVGEKYPNLLRAIPEWTYLDDTFEEIDCAMVNGLRIWGCPHTREFHDWAFNMPEEELHKHHMDIKPCDIILTHGPPLGFGDLVPRQHKRKIDKGHVFESHESVGSRALTRVAGELEPQLVVFGHIHCDQSTRRFGETIMANVAHVDEHYRPYYPPQIFEIKV